MMRVIVGGKVGIGVKYICNHRKDKPIGGGPKHAIEYCFMLQLNERIPSPEVVSPTISAHLKIIARATKEQHYTSCAFMESCR